MKSFEAKKYFIKRISILIYWRKTCFSLLLRRQKLKKREQRRHRFWHWEKKRRERFRLRKRKQKRLWKAKQRRKEWQRRKNFSRKELERFLTREKETKKESKHFLTSVMKKSKRVLTTWNDRVKDLIADKNKRRKLHERKRRWVRVIDLLIVDVSFNFIDFII